MDGWMGREEGDFHLVLCVGEGMILGVLGYE